MVLQIGGHHSKEEFAVRGKEPKDEVQIYTWKDATLRELTDLVWILLHLNSCSSTFVYIHASLSAISKLLVLVISTKCEVAILV